MGFTDVADYPAGKVDWVINGLPVEGETASWARAVDAMTTAPACRLDDALADISSSSDSNGSCVVVNEAGVVIGLVTESSGDPRRRVCDVMLPGPSTFRPGVPADELARYLREHDLDHALLTTAEGVLVGVTTRDALESVLHISETAEQL